MNIERKHARAIREILKRTDPLMDEVFDIPNLDNYKEASEELFFDLQTNSVFDLDTIAASVAGSLSYSYGSEIGAYECQKSAEKILYFINSLK